MMDGLYLIAVVAGQRIGIDAQMIEAVVQVGEVIAVPRADPIVAGLYALRSRVLTLIDCQYRVTGKPADRSVMRLAVIASVGNSQFGFLVEKVIDVASTSDARLQPLPASAGVWTEFVVGHADFDGQPVMLVDLEKLVARDAMQHAA
jgi:purine-binding chemotaxis protein CheW